jgi:hypothetical protein
MRTTQKLHICGAMLMVLALGSLSVFAQPLSFRSDLPGTFVDISATGTPLGLADDDVAAIPLTVTNPVFDGTTCWVANNGLVGFEEEQLQPPITDPIPSSNIWAGNQALVPFGDDIGNDTGDVFWEVQSTIGRASVLIIQWHNKRFTGSTDTARFQIQIRSDPGPDSIYAQLLYADIEQPFPNGGAISTIGYQDGGAGFNDVQWSYQTAGAVSNGSVLSLVPEPCTAFLAAATFALIRRR